MSSRREKEKRLRPRNNPYKRNQFDKAKYLRLPVSESNSTTNSDFTEDEFFDDDEDEGE